jgi:hypothetical protein
MAAARGSKRSKTMRPLATTTSALFGFKGKKKHLVLITTVVIMRRVVEVLFILTIVSASAASVTVNNISAPETLQDLSQTIQRLETLLEQQRTNTRVCLVQKAKSRAFACEINHHTHTAQGCVSYRQLLTFLAYPSSETQTYDWTRENLDRALNHPHTYFDRSDGGSVRILPKPH